MGRQKLTIVTQDGDVTGVISDHPEELGDLEIEIINYDIECVAKNCLTPIRQAGGMIEYAIVTSGMTVERSTIGVIRLDRTT
jgi:hypothetical protein